MPRENDLYSLTDAFRVPVTVFGTEVAHNKLLLNG